MIIDSIETVIWRKDFLRDLFLTVCAIIKGPIKKSPGYLIYVAKATTLPNKIEFLIELFDELNNRNIAKRLQKGTSVIPPATVNENIGSSDIIIYTIKVTRGALTLFIISPEHQTNSQKNMMLTITKLK
jgi:hypothetical protein